MLFFPEREGVRREQADFKHRGSKECNKRVCECDGAAEQRRGTEETDTWYSPVEYYMEEEQPSDTWLFGFSKS